MLAVIFQELTPCSFTHLCFGSRNLQKRARTRNWRQHLLQLFCLNGSSPLSQRWQTGFLGSLMLKMWRMPRSFFLNAQTPHLSLSLSLPFSSHSFQLKTTKILGIKYFSKFKGFFTVLTGQVCSFVFNPCPTSSATCLFNFYNVHI